MRYTLIEMVQRILESMDSDEVSDVSQTPESLAVANVIKECYFNIVSDSDLPNHKGIFQLDASGDSDKPCLMSMPANALDLAYLKYNIGTTDNPVWQDIYFKPLEEFMRMFGSTEDDTTIGTSEITVNGGTFTFKFKNDIQPCWYTTTDDVQLIFDAYDSSVDSTLQKVKTFCYGNVLPVFTLENTFVPDLNPRQFQLLLQDSKATAFIELKQVPNPKAEEKARKGKILSQRTKETIDNRSALEKIQRYGRQ